MGKVLGWAAVVLLLQVATAFAEDPKTKGKELSPEEAFKAIDVNQDGKVTLEEADREFGLPPGFFDILDVNEDKTITADEFSHWYEAPRTKKLLDELAPKTFHVVDLNKDGKIAQDEWIGQPEDFAKKDLNKDGSISKEEAQKTAPQTQGK